MKILLKQTIFMVAMGIGVYCLVPPPQEAKPLPQVQHAIQIKPATTPKPIIFTT